MVKACSVGGCKNRSAWIGDMTNRFFGFPKTNERRTLWAEACQRITLTGEPWVPKLDVKAVYVCWKHFVNGQPSTNPGHVDYIPSINLPDTPIYRSGKRKPPEFAESLPEETRAKMKRKSFQPNKAKKTCTMTLSKPTIEIDIAEGKIAWEYNEPLSSPQHVNHQEEEVQNIVEGLQSGAAFLKDTSNLHDGVNNRVVGQGVIIPDISHIKTEPDESDQTRQEEGEGHRHATPHLILPDSDKTEVKDQTPTVYQLPSAPNTECLLAPIIGSYIEIAPRPEKDLISSATIGAEGKVRKNRRKQKFGSVDGQSTFSFTDSRILEAVEAENAKLRRELAELTKTSRFQYESLSLSCKVLQEENVQLKEKNQQLKDEVCKCKNIIKKFVGIRTKMTEMGITIKPPPVTAQTGPPVPTHKGPPIPAQKGPPIPAQKGPPIPAQKGPPIPTHKGPPIPTHKGQPIPILPAYQPPQCHPLVLNQEPMIIVPVPMMLRQGPF